MGTADWHLGHLLWESITPTPSTTHPHFLIPYSAFHSSPSLPLLCLSLPPRLIPRDSNVPRPGSPQSTVFWTEKSPQAGVSVVQLEHQRTVYQETWVPVPALTLLHSVTLSKSLPLNEPQYPQPPNKIRGYLNTPLDLKCPLYVSWPTVSNSFLVTTGGSPVTLLLKMHWHNHINSYYCGEGQGLLQKIADLNRAQGVSWQHCSQAARGREEKQPICVCSCHISEQHSNLVNINLLNTEFHRL